MGRCIKNETWLSFINGKPDGAFTIESINGGLHGHHGGDPIDGDCDNSSIYFHRRRFIYDGQYVTDEDIRGHRYTVIFNKGRVRLDDDDVWTAQHATLVKGDEKDSAR